MSDSRTHIIGVLALQGDFAEHVRIITKLHHIPQEVRTVQDLKLVDALILPGGESTAMSRLLKTDLRDAIHTRVQKGMPVYGTCAGAILLAKHVEGKNPPQALQLMDFTVERNAYGTQLQSESVELKLKNGKTIPASFIRAPKIVKLAEGVEILAEFNGSPALVRQGNLLAGTFHPEVLGECTVHEMMIDLIQA